MSDKELLKIASQFTKGLLGERQSSSMCYAVSAPLQGFLSVCGFETKLIEGEINVSTGELWEHYWLELPDGRILDPTANQFRTPSNKEMPNIYLGEKPYWYE